MTPDADTVKAETWSIIEPLHGWCTREKSDALVDLVLTAHPRTCVEIGVFGGRSLIAIGMALRALDEGGMAYGIDPWRLEAALEGDVGEENRDWWSNKVDLDDVHRSCMTAIWTAGLEPHVTVIRAASQHVARLFPGKSIDVIHCDGNHSEASSLRDVRTYVPLLKDGGYFLFDDSDWATTQKAVRLLDATLHHTGAVGSCLIYRRV